MSFLAYLLLLALSGLIVGALARLALPGRDPMSIWQTIAVGVGGSLLAGIVSSLLFHRSNATFLLSLAFAAGIVYLIRRSRGGGLTDPGAPPRH
ncbi:MAG: hypothetical protein QOJ89_496 [bacterium]|jgi:uncharacterized membrane protein YeaQ/YmgE (transglycosylase-associated protein family)